jgi:hypothetical protein
MASPHVPPFHVLKLLQNLVQSEIRDLVDQVLEATMAKLMCLMHLLLLNCSIHFHALISQHETQSLC